MRFLLNFLHFAKNFTQNIKNCAKENGTVQKIMCCGVDLAWGKLINELSLQPVNFVPKRILFQEKERTSLYINVEKPVFVAAATK